MNIDKTINAWKTESIHIASKRLGRVMLRPTLEKIIAQQPDQPKPTWAGEHAIEATLAHKAEIMLSSNESTYLPLLEKIQEETVTAWTSGTLL